VNPSADQIHDIEPPYFFLTPDWVWWSCGAGVCAVLALIALVYLILNIRKNKLNQIHKIALAKLAHSLTLVNVENPEPYARFISETIRGYIAARFGFPITLYTTEEFLAMMEAGVKNPLTVHQGLLRDFLTSCDQLKFAKYTPGRPELDNLYQTALAFVTATKPLSSEQLPRQKIEYPRFTPSRVTS
jgi:hypothetical protein